MIICSAFYFFEIKNQSSEIKKQFSETKIHFSEIKN